MSLTYGFYNSQNGDRKYNALQLSSIFDGIISDGVYASYGDHLMVSPSSGMTVKVGSGRAWLDHTWTYNDADYPLDISTSEVTLKRIDTVVLEVDRTDSIRMNKLLVVKGTASSDPVAPTLTKEDNKKQYPLADILVKAGVTEITASDITNRIGTTDLPWVTGIIDHVTSEDLVKQWRTEFETLLASMEEMIGQVGSTTIIDNSVGASAIIKSGSNAVTASTVKAIADEDGAIKVNHLSTDITYAAIGLDASQVRYIRIGTGEPSADTGSDGDLYLQYTE